MKKYISFRYVSPYSLTTSYAKKKGKTVLPSQKTVNTNPWQNIKHKNILG
jgi:hypothetical protein